MQRLVPFMLVALLLNAPVQAQQGPVPQQPESAESLLIQSYLLGKELVPEERAVQLSALTEAAIEIQPSLGRLWAEELFQMASDMPAGPSRAYSQRNALVDLSAVDPDRALQLLRLMDVPGEQRAEASEDLRASAARAVFPALWKARGQVSLGAIRSQADAIGETGQYPYMATSGIISDLMDKDPSSATSLFSEATSYYRRSSQGSGNSEYVEFILSLRDKVPRPLMLDAVKLTVARLEEGSRPEEGTAFRAQVQTEKGVASFRSQASRLLFELMPLIRDLDQDWAKSLIEKHSELNQPGAGSEVRQSQGVVIRGAKDQRQTAAAEQRAMQRALMRQIEAVMEKQPDEALRLAANLNDPLLQAVVMSDVATRLSSNDPQRAATLLAKTKAMAFADKPSGDNSDLPQRLKLLVSVARASASMGDRVVFRSAMARAFDLGQEMFQQDLDLHPSKRAFFADGVQDLMQLATLGGHADPSLTLASVEGCPNKTLQAYLLIATAQGMHEQSLPQPKP